MASAINTGLSAKARNKVAAELSKLLADTYAVYLKTHGYHWNVRGPNFAALHALFMDEYTEMWAAIDEVAERIRALGSLAPQGYAALGQLSQIADGDPDKTAQAMVQELLTDHEAVVSTLRAALPVAQEADDEVSVGLITDRLTAHEKHAWLLRSSLG